MIGGKIMDERIVDKIREVTGNIYAKACEVVGFSNREIQRRYYAEEITAEEMNRKHEELDEVYRDLLCKLSSSALTNILLIHDEGRIMRAQKTLDSIATELFERELKGEEKGNT